MNILKIAKYSKTHEVVVLIEHNEKQLAYHAAVLIMATGARCILHIRKAHFERLTTSEKRQIKILITNHLNTLI